VCEHTSHSGFDMNNLMSVCVCVCVFFYPSEDLNLNAHTLMGTRVPVGLN